MRLATLLTCHNRRETTLASLRGLFAQKLAAEVQMSVFLVDDGSTDGTAAAVEREFPQVKILSGDGSLFWAGGMRMAFTEALKEDFDYYFWLNDDSRLDPDALMRLIETGRELCTRGNGPCVVVGAMREPETGVTTYGGHVRCSRISPTRFRLLEPGAEAQPCATFNGNAVLISREVAARVGNISPVYKHAMGDTDYGLRARKLGCTVWLASGFAGVCHRNGIENTWLDLKLPLRERLQKAFTVKGLPPREFLCFVRAHGGVVWPLIWLRPYLRLITQSLFRRLHRPHPNSAR